MGIDFRDWNENSATWNKLSCGINFTSYTLKIEYLGRGEKGDLYRFTVYDAVPEKSSIKSPETIAKDGIIEYTGVEQALFQQAGVVFGLRGSTNK